MAFTNSTRQASTLGSSRRAAARSTRAQLFRLAQRTSSGKLPRPASDKMDHKTPKESGMVDSIAATSPYTFPCTSLYVF